MSTRLCSSLARSGVIRDLGFHSTLTPIKLDTTALTGGSLVMLLFVDDDPEPRYVLRVPREPQHDRRIAANYAALQALATVPDLRGHVPAPVYAGPVEGLNVTVETCMPGLPIAVQFRVARDGGNREDTARLFSLAADWLWHLHEVTTASEETDRTSSWLNRLEWWEAHGRQQSAAVRESLEAARRTPWPTARLHGDYNPNNILIREDESLGVVDWEFSTVGCVLFDLFVLARYAVFCPPGEECPDPALALALWDPRAQIGRAFGSALARYEARYGLRRDQCRMLFSLFVAYLVALHEDMTREGPDRATESWRDLLEAVIGF